MSSIVLNQSLLKDTSFWTGKKVELPKYDRASVPVKSLCFSAGRMAYGHTADILQDILNETPDAGAMVGVETYGIRYVAELSASDYLVTQLIYENEKDVVIPKIQGAIPSVLYVDDNRDSLTWKRLLEYARDPELQFATINAPEGAYGVLYSGGEFAEATSDALKMDLKVGTVKSDPAKWAAFALARYKAGLNFALISCTNFSGNGHVTGGAVRLVAREWEKNGFAPKGFLAYLSDPKRFSFPNCMIDRIAVPPDENTQKTMENLGIDSHVVVTERTRYWVVEDIFPAGRPDLEKAEGVILTPDYAEVKKYEDMKLRILNMSHSVIAGLGVVLGYRGAYGIYRAMRDSDIKDLITRIMDLVIETVERPGRMDPKDFAKDAMERLQNPNIPDDPMRIALNGSTKVLPRFMDTYYAAQEKGIEDERLTTVLIAVAGFLRYTLGVDDSGERYGLESDPIKSELEALGGQAAVGSPDSAAAFRPLLSNKDVMGKDLFQHGKTGEQLEELLKAMLGRPRGVRETLKKVLKGK